MDRREMDRSVRDALLAVSRHTEGDWQEYVDDVTRDLVTRSVGLFCQLVPPHLRVALVLRDLRKTL